MLACSSFKEDDPAVDFFELFCVLVLSVLRSRGAPPAPLGLFVVSGAFGAASVGGSWSEAVSLGILFSWPEF